MCLRACQKRKKRKEDKKGVGKINYQNSVNLWPYVDALPILAENKKVTKDEISTIECRSQYSIKTIPDSLSENEKNDWIYSIFGELMNKGAKFMRQWTRCFALTHQISIKNSGCGVFQNKKEWSYLNGEKSVKDDMKGDELLLLVLFIITGTHVFVNLTNYDYWTSLKE